MIAFTDDCHRIGYGGGFYDMTLQHLRNAVTVGIAFDIQKITDSFYKADPHD
jgi:5-formyltetrahydrofolate cyclo-ligase